MKAVAMESMRSQKGFTLAELLIVVAIILVLVAIAIPVFTGATQKAEEATCAANRTSL
ncbi:MAG: prepilin-type N-terminal cleavage/methylation domain-containing protein, partial [Raoultibacter sp.]